VYGKLREIDEIPQARFVTDLNLTPELGVTWPLKGYSGFSIWRIYYSTEGVTDADTNMRSCLGTQWRRNLRIY
jgi:hypothetical protein